VPQSARKLISTLSEIKSGKVFRGVLWILGEYVESIADIQSAMREIRKVIGEIPILASELSNGFWMRLAAMLTKKRRKRRAEGADPRF